jgi:hypothetical protein
VSRLLLEHFAQLSVLISHTTSQLSGLESSSQYVEFGERKQ